MTARTRVVDGRVVVVVDPSRELVEVLDRAHRQHVARGGLPIPSASELVCELARAATLAAHIRGSAFGTDARQDVDDPGSWTSVRGAAAAAGIGERAMRQRIARGCVDARRIGGRWLVRTTGV